jgi:hypothetical protein
MMEKAADQLTRNEYWRIGEACDRMKLEILADPF